MISDTQAHKIGGSLMVVIPDAYVKSLKIDKNSTPKNCTIEDIGKSEVRIVFG